ncbi:Ribosomal RNA large subunit methyltransferase N [Candidatus Riesia pediculischaeffi PTSU]|uniref:Ribosomal RNA large subunit methyltransferase N n=1 Tax=Candidatus Riesia pediculischaeffi PTSU TaxID=1401651 RepID=A0A0C1V7B1_9ENTR|nr:Ribosomal RNA large subunit methyltransferase N [Candidatus Riesia pediculischaeffi PTSU]
MGQIWTAGKRLRERFLSEHIKRSNSLPFTNIVIMGTGEPLFNFNNIIRSIRIVADHHGFNFSEKKIVLSTSGISPMIEKLLEYSNVGLAISLHAPNDEIRSSIMPINRKYNVQSILDSIHRCQKRHVGTKNITIEYVMLKKINDDLRCAYQLAKILKGLSVKINLIPFNPVDGVDYECSTAERTHQFLKILKKFGFVTTVRKTKGLDIRASCGQLSYR